MLWKQHSSLPAHTCVSYNIMEALLKLDGASAAGVHTELHHVSLGNWASSATAFFEHASTDAMLAADAAGNDVEIRASTIPGAGLGVFALRDFAKGERILPFWGPLVYEGLYAAATSHLEEHQNKWYGSGVASTTAKFWLNNTTEICTSSEFWDVTEWRPGQSFRADPGVTTKRCYEFCPCGRSSKCFVWVVPSSVCAAGNVNDARRNRTRGSGDTTAAAARRKKNVRLTHNKFPVTTFDELVRADVVVLLVTRRICQGEELFLLYGTSYGGM